MRAGTLGVDDPTGCLRAARAYRKGSLRGFGNAIVPQVAAVFVRAYMDRAGGDEKLMDEFDAHQTSGQMALAVL